jgi:protein ImuB
VRRADGPERIFGEWWHADDEFFAVRDYFQVEDQDGRRFWLFREGDGEHPESGGMGWYLHGLFG